MQVKGSFKLGDKLKAKAAPKKKAAPKADGESMR